APPAKPTPIGALETLVEAEDIFVIGPLHTLLVIFPPYLSPRPAVHIGNLVLDDGSRRNGRRVAVDRVDRRDAFDEDVRCAFVVVVRLHIIAHDTDGLDERLRVVEDRLVIQPDEAA